MTARFLSLLLVATLWGCSNQPASGPNDQGGAEPVVETTEAVSEAPAESYTHTINYETPYYTNGPQQARPPDGKVAAGTKVTLLSDAGSYSIVKTADGIEAYVATMSLTPISGAKAIQCSPTTCPHATKQDGGGLLAKLSSAFSTTEPLLPVSAHLRIAAQPEVLVFQTAETQPQRSLPNAFKIYKATQVQLIRSHLVLTAALRPPQVAKLLDCIKTQTDDPIGWLQQHLLVTFPGNAEIMQVSLPGVEPKQAAKLINAVVDAYMKLVVDTERNQRRVSLDKINRLYSDMESQVREERTQLKRLVQALGIGDKEALSLRQQLAVQQMATLQKELLSIELEQMRVQIDQIATKNALEAVKEESASDIELDAFVQNDPAARKLFEELYWLKSDAQRNESGAVSGASSRWTAKFKEDHQRTQQQYEARREELREQLKRQKVQDLKKQIDQFSGRIAVFDAQKTQLQGHLEEQRKGLSRFGGESIDVEMKRREIAQLEEVFDSVARVRERLKVELRSAPRITLFQKASAPK